MSPTGATRAHCDETSSAAPTSSVTTTGRPLANASPTVRPNGSYLLGWISRSQICHERWHFLCTDGAAVAGNAKIEVLKQSAVIRPLSPTAYYMNGDCAGQVIEASGQFHNGLDALPYRKTTYV